MNFHEVCILSIRGVVAVEQLDRALERAVVLLYHGERVCEELLVRLVDLGVKGDMESMMGQTSSGLKIHRNHIGDSLKLEIIK